jgi:catalase
VHARGSGAHGFFECYEPLTKITRAALFSEAGKRTPVFVRFSTVAGERGSTDTARDVRGFAVKFYTDEGNWDLVGNNMPVFFIQDAMKFPDLIHAVKPEPHNAMPQAASAHDTFWDFVSLMPESVHMQMWVMSDRAIPRSYRMMQGFGVHTFRLVNERGDSVFVKFHWNPRAGTHSLDWDEAVKISGADPDFHRRDLWEAIEAAPIPSGSSGLQIFTEEQAEKVQLRRAGSDQDRARGTGAGAHRRPHGAQSQSGQLLRETEQVAFCAAHIVPGIDFTNDPLLAGRIHSYVDTQISRLGGPTSTRSRSTRPLRRYTTTSAMACTARRFIAAACLTSPTRSAVAARFRRARVASCHFRNPWKKTRCAASREVWRPLHAGGVVLQQSDAHRAGAHRARVPLRAHQGADAADSGSASCRSLPMSMRSSRARSPKGWDRRTRTAARGPARAT